MATYYIDSRFAPHAAFFAMAKAISVAHWNRKARKEVAWTLICLTAGTFNFWMAFAVDLPWWQTLLQFVGGLGGSFGAYCSTNLAEIYRQRAKEV